MKNDILLSDNKIEIILIRHGITRGNVERRFLGWRTDTPLTAEGRTLIIKDNYPRVNVCFSSPMIRCIETANIIYPGLNPIVVDELKEIDFGDFENLCHEELDGNPEYQAWIDSRGKGRIPNGEDMNSYTNRVIEGIRKVKEIATDMGESTVAATVHGGTIMAACSYFGISDYFAGIVENGGTRTIRV